MLNKNGKSKAQQNLLIGDTFSTSGLYQNNEELNFTKNIPNRFSKSGNAFQTDITSPEQSMQHSFVKSSLIEFCNLLPHGIDKYCIIMDYEF